MQIYIFESEVQKVLRAFAADPAGSKLPAQFKPWHAIAVIAPGKAPPYRLPRKAIEDAIEEHGFQLWRKRAKPTPA